MISVRSSSTEALCSAPRKIGRPKVFSGHRVVFGTGKIRTSDYRNTMHNGVLSVHGASPNYVRKIKFQFCGLLVVFGTREKKNVRIIIFLTMQSRRETSRTLLNVRRNLLMLIENKPLTFLKHYLKPDRKNTTPMKKYYFGMFIVNLLSQTIANRIIKINLLRTVVVL